MNQFLNNHKHHIAYTVLVAGLGVSLVFNSRHAFLQQARTGILSPVSVATQSAQLSPTASPSAAIVLSPTAKVIEVTVTPVVTRKTTTTR